VAEPAADDVVEAVAEHGGEGQAEHQGQQGHVADGGQGAGDEEQGVAGKEGHDDEAGLGEDDEKEDGVDPGAVLLDQDGQVLVQVQDQVDELQEEAGDCVEKFHGAAGSMGADGAAPGGAARPGF